MATLVEARLLNEPFGDPGLLVDFRFGRHAILFDLGDLRQLAPRTVQRVETVCVSHRHMDHFAGFDDFLRLRLYRSDTVRLFGPPGFVDGVEAKLAAYTWNLLGRDSSDLRLVVSSVDESGEIERAEFRAREVFVRRDLTPEPEPGVLARGPDHVLEYAVLDHGTPVLAFAIQETLSVNVIAERLPEYGLDVGPWLTEAKTAVRRGDPDDAIVDAGGRPARLGDLRESVLTVGPGQRVAYVTDAGPSDENGRRIRRIAAGADHLYIEGGFLDEDAAIAAERLHLTARQAGSLAAAAGARRATPFHFSSRYLGREHELREEFRAAFEAGSAGG